MSGNNFLLDTNAVIFLLKNRNFIEKIKAIKEIFYISIITEIELLSYPEIKKQEESDIKKFLLKIGIINIDEAIKSKTIEIKRNSSIKLPDALICATAIINKLTLVTDDKQLLNLKGFKILSLKELFLD